MTKIKAVFDSNEFDKLIVLPSEEFLKLIKKFELFTTAVVVKELNRIKDEIKREKILKLIKERFQVLDDGVFSFASYTDKVSEDSAVGFSRHGSESKGRWLRYEDADLINEIGIERRKIPKGTSFNDTAIALATNKEAFLITEEKDFRKRLKRAGLNTLSLDELLQKGNTMQKLYFISNDGLTRFNYFIWENNGRFFLAIITISRTPVGRLFSSHMESLAPIEGESQVAVRNQANQIMSTRLNGTAFTEVEKFDEIEDLIQTIIDAVE